ncbi:MAG: glycosyltransferase [Bacteroidia bacterium]|nr:glycosyltransferase [Bacteroidia bacterium]MDW8236422.1 glycosyltransferase family 2 protein [Bacteroidia bacterium]
MKPYLSIITVTFNAQRTLPITLRSVRQQTWKDWEHILVDGASTDGTVELIRAYAQDNPKVRWISEPDEGIYDAMNKGISMAQGEFLVFLNAGDSFWESRTLEELFAKAPPEADFLYGEHRYVNEKGEVLPRRRHRPYPQRELRAEHFRTGMVICHQAMIVRRQLVLPYDPSVKVGSEIDWVIRILRKNPHTYDSQMVLIRYLVGGHTERHIWRQIWNRTRLVYRHFGVSAVLESWGAMVLHKLRGGYPSPV